MQVKYTVDLLVQFNLIVDLTNVEFLLLNLKPNIKGAEVKCLTTNLKLFKSLNDYIKFQNQPKLIKYKSNQFTDLNTNLKY